MKNAMWLPLLFIGFLFSACNDKDTTGNLDLNFIAEYDGEPFIVLEKYDYTDEVSLQFQRFNFYISDIALIDEQGDATTLLDIEFVDFDAIDTEEEAQSGVVIQIGEVPTGNYKSIQIGLGVPSDLNATQESDYSDSHPLGRDSHYWSAWNSYIFTMINGKTDTDGDGIHDDGSILYHCGSDETYRMKTMTVPIDITEDATTTLRFKVNLYQILKDGDGMIDVEAHPDTHDISNLELANKIMDNFAAFALQLAQ
jgi:hypothetical protein